MLGQRKAARNQKRQAAAEAAQKLVAEQMRSQSLPSEISSADLRIKQRRKISAHGHKASVSYATELEATAAVSVAMDRSSLLRWITDSSTINSEVGPRARRGAKITTKRSSRAGARRLEAAKRELYGLVPGSVDLSTSLLGTGPRSSTHGGMAAGGHYGLSKVSSAVDASTALLQWAQQHEARHIDTYSAADGASGMHTIKPGACSQGQVSQIKCWLDGEGFITGLAFESEAGITAPAVCGKGLQEDGGTLQQGESIVEIISCRCAWWLYAARQ